ncbi:GNAT family N-acetyltransferase [Streptomyces sp. NPDC002851]
MTTTLRPTGPIQEETGGVRSRAYDVCVNGRPVGRTELATHPVFGHEVGLIRALRIDEADRRRGRGTVAALAAEEVLRGWGCRRVEAALPAAAPEALRLATALGYVERNRAMSKPLTGMPPDLPAGSAARPLTEREFTDWLAESKTSYARSWIERGVPEEQAYAKSEADHTALLSQGLATPGVQLSVLMHDDVPVGTLWLAEREGQAFVYNVKVAEEHRRHGHGRTLMLVAEQQATAAGFGFIGLNVFAGNTPALRLYESLGYAPVTYHVYKPLL